MDVIDTKAPEVGAPDIEVTATMIAAGDRTYYENAMWGWDNPGEDELNAMLRKIYVAMATAAAKP